MPRFFTDFEPDGIFFLGGEQGAHMVKSLRMRAGETAVICAGTGKDFLCTVTETAPDGAYLRVDGITESRGEPKTKVTVCQCLPKSDKLETVVQKSVELGAFALRPVISSRCIVKTDEKSAAKKAARLQKIAFEAAQQSGRGAVPEILPTLPLKAALEEAKKQGDIMFFYENGKGSLREAIEKSGNNISIFIGPEGGFSPEEAELAREYGGAVLSLGPRILRTETAPICALSAIMFEKNEMNVGE